MTITQQSTSIRVCFDSFRGVGPRLPSHMNNVKLCGLTRVVRQIDLLIAHLPLVFDMITVKHSYILNI